MGAFGSGLVGGMQQMAGLQMRNEMEQQMRGLNQEALGKQIVAGAQKGPGFEMPQDMMPQLQMQDLRSRILASMLGGHGMGGRF